LRLTGFRNYGALSLDLTPEPVVTTGPNGAGKTNLLEAISLLAPGRGLRQARLSEIELRLPDNQEKPAGTVGWAVAATIETMQGPIDISTGCFPPDEKRIVQISGARAKSQSALADFVSAVWLTPQMDRFFTDGPSVRRRFLDRLVFGFDTTHAGRVSAFENAMRQRGKLLRHGFGDDIWLSVLESTIAERGVAIAAARREMADRLNRACAVSRGLFPHATLMIQGDLETWLDTYPALEVEDRLRRSLAENRNANSDSNKAPIGPHRSELRVLHVEKGQPANLCSTGEQKALLIAIVLADTRLRAAERNAAPLLLLDEVAAHLDGDRRESLFEEIFKLGAQVWLTGTDHSVFSAMQSRAQFLDVRDGQVKLQ
tara:strand:- start:6 stop:1121 length:1116 start_codon:yes stop_codon:yes gene_type:complete